ncbi:MAG: pyridoxal-phosphate dependent enzyme [Thermoanaerobaculia bacterium]|nr:pyridoxal-phosphate dependent enzyme [Thermoanaerobaculia bacterium]
MSDAPAKTASTPHYHDNILQTVGDTPLVRLNALAKGVKPLVLAKLESFNPGKSNKDRVGIHIVEMAEREGALKPGGTIVEATSGNTGLGLALAAAVKGYACICVMPDKVGQEKRDILKAHGARVVITPTSAPPGSPERYTEVAKRLASEIRGGFLANQYFNPHNPGIHYLTTGPEIWRDTAGRVTCYVASLGTGGSTSGAGRYLKEQNPRVRVVGVEPVGSVLGEYQRTGKLAESHPYLVEGIGQETIPGNVWFDVIDEILTVTDRESFHVMRRLSREEGIFVGGSSGTALAGALKVAERMTAEDIVVVMLPDTGERYLSKFHSDAWLADNGMLDATDLRVGDLLRQKAAGDLPPLLTLAPSDQLRTALSLIRRHHVSQLPIVNAAGEFVGTVVEPKLFGALLDGSAMPEDPVSAVMEGPLPRLSADEPVVAATRMLTSVHALLVEMGGRPVGILTRIDVIGYVAP